MSKRQQRLKRIAAIEQEYLAAATAADWLAKQLKADPSFGDQYGWEGRGGLDFSENVETTYIVRIYAEFEAGLRDYWRNYLGKDTKPGMAQLVRDAIPARQWFKQDDIDNFTDAWEIFQSPMIAVLDEREDYGEDRWIGIGLLQS